jgi:hypothetical protein
LDDFKIKTEALYRSVDYITRIMSVSRGVSWIFLYNYVVIDTN